MKDFDSLLEKFQPMPLHDFWITDSMRGKVMRQSSYWKPDSLLQPKFVRSQKTDRNNNKSRKKGHEQLHTKAHKHQHSHRISTKESLRKQKSSHRKHQHSKPHRDHKSHSVDQDKRSRRKTQDLKKDICIDSLECARDTGARKIEKPSPVIDRHNFYDYVDDSNGSEESASEVGWSTKRNDVKVNDLLNSIGNHDHDSTVRRKIECDTNCNAVTADKRNFNENNAIKQKMKFAIHPQMEYDLDLGSSDEYNQSNEKSKKGKLAKLNPFKTRTSEDELTVITDTDIDDSLALFRQNQGDSICVGLDNDKFFLKEIICRRKVLGVYRVKFDDLLNEKRKLILAIKGKKMDLSYDLADLERYRGENNELVLKNIELETLKNKKSIIERSFKDINTQSDTEASTLESSKRKLSMVESRVNNLSKKISAKKFLKQYLLEEREHNEEYMRVLSEIKETGANENAEFTVLYEQLVDLKGTIRVFVRLKPCRTIQKEMTLKSSRYFVSTKGSLVIRSNKSPKREKIREYSFTNVFSERASQNDVFNSFDHLIAGCFEGYSCTVLCYGQTQSGKSYTIHGTDDDPGLLLNTLHRMFVLRYSKPLWTFKLTASQLVIRNENIYDASQHFEAAPVVIVDNGSEIKLKGMEEIDLYHEEDFLQYIRYLHEYQARYKDGNSHAINVIKVSGESNEQGLHSMATFTIIDSASFDAATVKKHFNVSGPKSSSCSHIVLSRIFDELFRNVSTPSFRDSKITHFLRPSLSGDARFVFFLCISSEPEDNEKSLRALKLGSKAMVINLGRAKRKTSNQSSTVS